MTRFAASETRLRPVRSAPTCRPNARVSGSARAARPSGRRPRPPARDQWPTLAALAAVRQYHRLTTDRVARRGCLTETCGCDFVRDYTAPFPQDVRLSSIYSKGDGVVRWESCVVDYADNVEVTGSHVGLAFNRKVYRELGETLARETAGR